MNLSINPNLYSKPSFKAENMTPVNKPLAEKSKASDDKKQEIKIEATADSFDKKINEIETKTGVEHSKVSPDKKVEVKAIAAANVQTAEPQVQPESKSAAGIFFSKVSTSSAIVKGLVFGSMAGIFFGTLTAGMDMIYTGIKKIKNKEIKFYQIFNPKKSLSKSGRNLSIAVALGCVVGEIVSPLVKSKKQRSKQ